jgi:type III pantothenate kinase
MQRRYLLIDISNSFTKFAFATPERIGRTSRVPTRELTASKLRKLLERAVNGVVVSSVVPKKNAAVRSATRGHQVLFISASTELGIGIDYPQPQTIGADRLANAVAVAELYGCPAIVVDFGTAVTFDVVSGSRSYIGGVIAPGLESMTAFLYQRTALLPKLTLREPTRAIGKSTRAAMLAGAVHGYRGLVAEILRKICEENFRRARPKIVATGGYADLIARQLPQIDAVDPELTLHGLRLIAERNFA